jgi:hypothetical protein
MTAITVFFLLKFGVSLHSLSCQLRKLDSYLETEVQVSSTFPPVSNTQEDSALFSGIFRHIEELFRLGIGLHGSATAIFPLKTAYAMLKTRSQRHSQQIERCQRLMTVLRRKEFSEEKRFSGEGKDHENILSST